MLPEELKKLDDILFYIITDRYLIGRTSEIVPVFAQLKEIHFRYCSSLEKVSSTYLQTPHTRTFIEEVMLKKRQDMEYMRQKAHDLGENLEEDDMIPMAQETVNFLNTLQNYLTTAGGQFLNFHNKHEDILTSMNEGSFVLEEDKTEKLKTASISYELRKESRDTSLDDLGFKIYTIVRELEHNWTELTLAYENLEFLNKEKK